MLRVLSLNEFFFNITDYIPCFEALWKLKLKVAQLCLTLCDLMDYNPPGSSIQGILQARILEWVAIPFSKGSSQPRDRTWVSCIAGRFFTVWATREAPLVFLPGEFHGQKSLVSSSPWVTKSWTRLRHTHTHTHTHTRARARTENVEVEKRLLKIELWGVPAYRIQVRDKEPARRVREGARKRKNPRECGNKKPGKESVSRREGWTV